MLFHKAFGSSEIVRMFLLFRQWNTFFLKLSLALTADRPRGGVITAHRWCILSPAGSKKGKDKTRGRFFIPRTNIPWRISLSLFRDTSAAAAHFKPHTLSLYTIRGRKRLSVTWASIFSPSLPPPLSPPIKLYYMRLLSSPLLFSFPFPCRLQSRREKEGNSPKNMK